jgi:serine/threonine protein kinase
MLHHPNIIEYFDSFAHDKSMMIVMEYAAGGTLFDLLESRVEQQVNKKFDQILEILFRFLFH